MEDQIETPSTVSKRYRIWEDPYNMVGIAILPIVMLIVMICLLIRGNMDSLQAIKWGCIWGFLFYTLIVIPVCWRFPRGNYALIMHNWLKPIPPVTSDIEITDIENPVPGQRGIQGPSFVLPWERQLGEPVEMVVQKNLIVPVEVNDMNGYLYTITYAIPISPAPGKWLPNWRRFQDAPAEELIIGHFETETEQAFANRDGEAIMANLVTFKTQVEGWLKGPNELHSIEKITSRFTGKPQVKSIEKGDKAQKAGEAHALTTKAEQISTIMERMGVPKALAAQQALQAVGLATAPAVEDITLRNPGGGSAGVAVAGGSAETYVLAGGQARQGRRNRRRGNPPQPTT